MNVGELLKERDRLTGVIAEAKTARSKLKQINTLIAMYGDEPNVSLDAHIPAANITRLSNVRSQSESARKSRAYRRDNGALPRRQKIKCSKCGNNFVGPQGFAAHNRAAHDGKAKVS